MPSPSKEILVYGAKTFKINVPAGASITFGPWSPPSAKQDRFADVAGGNKSGTLRIYAGAKSTSSIIAVFSGVTGFRDLSLDYAEMVALEEGAIMWKSDKDGYSREEKVTRAQEFADPTTPLLSNKKGSKS